MYRILKIKVENHEYLKNFELDLTLMNGRAASTVIFAGENGSGKTQILNLIKDFIANTPSEGYRPPNGTINCTLEFQILIDDKIYSTRLAKDSNGIVNMQIQDESGKSPPTSVLPFKAISSRSETNFIPRIIEFVSNSDVDKLTNKSKIFESSDDSATAIKQLFIEINNKDNSDHHSWEEENPGMGRPPKEFCEKKRMSRFNTAFTYMFGDDLKFSKIEEQDVLFVKNDQKFSIDNLSSGEKQIVFRGGHLIQNLNLFKDCTVIIDEPELSIHPKWQEKLLGFYRKLFSDGINDSQIFIATHSDHVVKSALENDNTIIIKIKIDNNNTITGEKIYKNGRGNILPRVTLGEVKWRIFDIPTLDFHCALFGYLQSIDIKTSTGNTVQLPLDKNGNSCSHSINELDDILEFLTAPAVPANLKNTHKYSPARIGDKTLCTYVRNQIDHPESSDRECEIRDIDLRTSIDFMSSICVLNNTP